MIRGNGCSFIKGTSGGGGNMMERIGARFYILRMYVCISARPQCGSAIFCGKNCADRLILFQYVPI